MEFLLPAEHELQIVCLPRQLLSLPVLTVQLRLDPPRDRVTPVIITPVTVMATIYTTPLLVYGLRFFTIQKEIGAALQRSIFVGFLLRPWLRPWR